eukprot:XP_005029793.2 synaptotagmin-like protein 2 isoform X5 [Anas platyrhynchos]
MDGKPEVIEELPSGRDKQLNAISPTTISEDKQMIKERRKPKQGKDSEEQNDKSLTESDCTRIKDKESGQEIKQQNQKSRVLEHHEHKLPAQKYESEKAIREKRRIREIRAFWERDKTIPSHKEKEVGINTNASGSGALKGLRESDKIKPTAERLPYGLDDQSKNTLRSAEMRCAIVASKNERENSFEFGPACDVRKTERTLPADSEIHEPTKLAKASNIKPRVSATSASPEIKDKDRKETFKGKVGASSQQKPNFQVFSLKEKMNEKSKNQISNPSQFQSLRNFWDAGVKLQSSIDRGDVSLPNNTIRNNTSVTHERKSKEDKGRDNVSNQVLIQHQTQASEREKPEKLDSVICELPLGSLTLKGLKVTHAQNTDSVQPVKKPVISQPQEQMGLHKHEVKEPIEKSIVSTKEHPPRGSQKMQAGLQNLLRETSVCQPPELRVGMKASETMNNISQTNCTGESTSQQDISQSEEVNETAERSVAPPKVSGLSSALEKLMKEASETPSPKPRRVDRTLQRTAEMQAKSTTYQHGGESQQEISESIEKSVAPSKVSGLSSALEKLQKEASETPPPKPKRVYSALNGTAEMQVKSTAYQHDGESQQEISESIEKSVAPSKVSGLSSALEKLLKEASETPPPKPKRVYNTERRTAEMQVERTAYLHDGESPREVSEFIERSVAPSKVSGLSSALEELLKEASETPPPKPKDVDNTLHGTAEMQVKNTNYQCDGDSLQEISESVEKSVAPPKVSGLSSALEKLLKEASETPPPKPKRVDNTLHGTAEMQVKNTNYQCDGDSLQEISESVEKSVAPPKVSGLSSALEKLLKEASETPPPKPKRVDRTLQRTAEMQVKSVTYQHNGASLQEKSGETTETSALSKAEYRLLDVNLQKLLKGVSETPGPMLENTDEKMHGKMSTSQSMCPPSQEERDHPREIEETIERTSVSDIAKFRDFSSSVERLLQEASEASSQVSREVHKQEKSGDFCMFPLQKESLFTTMSQPYHNALTTYTGMKTTIKSGTPEQNIEASVDTEASDKLKRNGALNQKEQRNMPPIDLLPLEGETNTAVNKPFKVNVRGRTDESTSSDASENNLESKELLRLRRTSTPLKDESNSPQPGGAQLCLAFQHEVTDEEDGYSSNLGSRFSDENSDSHSGTESSTRSEEELNPVLMALKRSADRKMPSKSLEDIPSATSNKGKIKIPKEELALSAEDGLKTDQDQERNENAPGISTVPPQPDQLFSNPEKLKGLSKSVPSFLQEEVSGSLMSVYSGDFGNVDVKGNIQFAIDYVEQLNELHIFICQCKDLAVADVKRQRSDPYVKTYLLPEKYKLGKRKTSVKKKTFNPVYNEILRYKIEKDLLKNQSLNISVWHNDTFGRNSFLGEVELDLGTWDWNDKSNKQINWFPLKPRTSTMALELENRGEMKLALKYVPQPTGGKKTLSTGEVHIWVKECHDLPPLRGNRLNSFIKCTILPDTSRKSRQKTRTVAKTTNPVFNHTMVYDGFRPEDLKEACIELTVWDHNKLANHFLGGLRIGLGTGRSYGTTVDWMDSTSDESALWEKMINLPNTWVEDTIPLRMLMVAKLTK